MRSTAVSTASLSGLAFGGAPMVGSSSFTAGKPMGRTGRNGDYEGCKQIQGWSVTLCSLPLCGTNGVNPGALKFEHVGSAAMNLAERGPGVGDLWRGLRLTNSFQILMNPPTWGCPLFSGFVTFRGFMHMSMLPGFVFGVVGPFQTKPGCSPPPADKRGPGPIFCTKTVV